MTNSPSTTAYQVLARKYRPRNFDDLIGHDAMVRTLENAFDAQRIAHAWILTGVRGIGKTTTARILARALNYETDAIDAPTIHMKEEGKHCQAIAEDRHPDVMEMDAASRTGVGDIRELIDAVRYAPTQARYKVYIIDEVHMLSKNAFNALLKTLEEPPEHVKFIFATTDIQKVPITVLSRCQRFDLKRFDVPMLTTHLQNICAKENRQVALEGLQMIARAAEGSVRDGLSILDQALIQYADDQEVSAALIQDMLGLADRQSSWGLLESCLSGDAATALTQFRGQYDAGTDPADTVKELLSMVHLCTRTKAAGADSAQYGAGGSADAMQVEKLCAQYGLAAFSRIWALMMGALKDIQNAPDQAAAAEMGLIRICYAADLPTPAEALNLLKKKINEGGMPSKTASPKPNMPTASVTQLKPHAQAEYQTKPHIQQDVPPIAPPPEHAAQEHSLPTTSSNATHNFNDIIALAASKRDMRLVTEMERYMKVTHFDATAQGGRIDFTPAPQCPDGLAGQLSKKLYDWTGNRWIVSVKNTQAEAQQTDTIKNAREKKAHAHPLIAHTKSLFPDVDIIVRKIESPTIAQNDMPYTDENE